MALDPILYRTALLDPATGAMSREWIKFFDQLTSKLDLFDSSVSDWTPTFAGWAGMTISAVVIHDCQCMRMGDMVLFKLYAGMTLGGAASNQIFISTPFPVAGSAFFTASTFACSVHPSGGTWIPSFGFVEPAGSLLKILMPNEALFPLGASTFILIEGFYRATD